MKKITIYIFAIVAMFMVSSCEDYLTQLEDPNNISLDEGNLEYQLSNIQLNFPGLFNAFSTQGAQLTRMDYMSGFTYDNAYTPVSFNFVYTTAYTGILVEADLVIERAEEGSLFVHAGMAKLFKAYTMMTLVDWFGNTPYSEAFDPTNFNPNLDDGDAVYAAALELIDEAIADLQNEDVLAFPDTDFYYDGDVDKWIKFANSLKLKYYLTTRLVNNNAQSEINSLVSEGNLITTADESFVFRYSTNRLNPDSRHPAFADAYINSPQLGDYVSNYYMYALYNEKDVVDPRLRYYFVRQVSEITDDPNELSCINNQAPDHYGNNTPYCALSDGYWGRDHGNADGIPPDGALRTVLGTYPAGGTFDANQFEGVAQDQGLEGAGIQPIMLNSYVDFMLAEAALAAGTAGDARASLELGIRNSIDYVIDFSAAAVADVDGQAFEPAAADIDTYVDEVLADYDAAGNDEKLDIIIKEYWLALHGNGIEAYNAYRRTGFPSTLQPHLNPTPGQFYRTLPYASNLVERNSNVSQKDGNAVRVFWDTNPDGFID